MTRTQLRNYFSNLASRLSHIQHSEETPAFFAQSDTHLLSQMEELSNDKYYLWLEPATIVPRFNSGDDVQHIWSAGFTVFSPWNEDDQGWPAYEQKEEQCQKIAEQILVRMRRDSELLTGGVFSPKPFEQTQEYKARIAWLRYLDISSIKYNVMDPTLFGSCAGIRAEFDLQATTMFNLQEDFWVDL